MEEGGSKMLYIIGGMLLAAMVILFVMGQFNKTKDSAEQADKVVQSMVDSLVNDKYLVYDGAVVKGSDVLSFIQTCRTETICIEVVNGSTTTEYVKKLSDLTQKADGVLAEAKDKANINTVYIDPTVDYKGEVLYYNDDASQSIIGVRFTKK